MSMFKLFRKEPIKVNDLYSYLDDNIDGFIRNHLTEEHINNIVLGIESLCKEHNLTTKDLILVNKGGDAITFQLDNKIIKLTFTYLYRAKSLTDYVSHSNYILKPDKEIMVDINNEFVCAHILETRKLDTSKIREKNVIDLYIKLREEGYLWEDTRARNIGMDIDGVIKLFDYGELICLHYLKPKEAEQKLYYHVNYKTYYNDEYAKRLTRKL